MNWRDVFNGTFGIAVVYDTRPLWMRALMSFLEYLPWMAIGGLFVLRFKYQKPVHPLAFGAGVVGFHALLVAYIFLAPGIDDYAHRQHFEPAAWSRNDGSNTLWPARLTMVDDLLAKYQLRGMTRASVQQLLGPPDRTNYFLEWDMVYRLGPERGLVGGDSEWLVIRLGPDGRVSEFRIARD
jgi:hypothetical protein